MFVCAVVARNQSQSNMFSNLYFDARNYSYILKLDKNFDGCLLNVQRLLDCRGETASNSINLVSSSNCQQIYSLFY